MITWFARSEFSCCAWLIVVSERSSGLSSTPVSLSVVASGWALISAVSAAMCLFWVHNLFYVVLILINFF